MRRGGQRIVMLLTIAMVIMLLTGVASFGAYMVLRGDVDQWPTDNGGSMQTWVPSAAVDDSLALLVLAGWTEQAVIDLSIAERELDTALSLLVHSTTLSDRERAGILLRLASAYREIKREDVSRSLYTKVGRIAILSPTLSNLTRIELLTEISAGLLRLGENSQATHFLDQGAVLARASEDLRPAQRRQATANLLELYARADAKQSEAAKKLTDLSDLDAGGVPASLPAISLETAALPFDLIGDSNDMETAAGELRMAIEEWLRYREQHPGEHSPSLMNGIEAALLRYDVSLQEHVTRGDGPEIDGIELKLGWLARKTQIAAGQLGISLVPEWERNLGQIQMEQTSTWREYFDLRRSIVRQAPAQDWERADWEVSLACAEALAGELGLLPEHDVVHAAIQLQDALERRNEQMPARDWSIEVNIQDGRVDYSLSSP